MQLGDAKYLVFLYYRSILLQILFMQNWLALDYIHAWWQIRQGIKLKQTYLAKVVLNLLSTFPANVRIKLKIIISLPG